MKHIAFLMFAMPAQVAAQSTPMLPVDDLLPYTQSAAVLSFMSAAVGSLEGCTGPVTWWEAPRDTITLLEARCDGEDEALHARLTFVIVRAGLDRPRMIPFRLELKP